MKEYEFHPVAEIFPLMEGAAYDELVSDIKEHGLRDAILLADGMIADGRNRFRACIDAGISPRFEKWDKKGSLIALVLSRNAHRRHLDRSQLAMVAARALPFFEQEATQREKAGTLAPNGARGKSAEKAAETLGAAPRTVERAKTVIDKGAAALVEAVDAGEVKVSDAAAIVDRPKSEQAAAVKAVKEGKARTVKAAVKSPEPTLPSVDEIGNELPQKLRPAFATAKQFSETNSALGEISKRLDHLATLSPFLHLQSVQADISNLKRAVKFAKPYAVCGYCNGKGCEACKRMGWVPKNIYESTPEQ